MIDKSKFYGTNGLPLTQSIFLELGYSEYSVYTLKDDDHEYKGRVYPSLKKLYLEMEDITEYEFSNKYYLGWKMWTRLCDNNNFKVHIEEWRLELEYKLRSRAAQEMIKAASKGSFQAIKWLSDRGWSERGAGRPSKAEKEQNKAIEKRIHDEYSADIVRLKAV